MATAHSTLFLGGRVFDGRRFADSLLVEDGRVVALGSRAEVLRAGPTGAERIELEGRCLMPGLIDSHVHVRESVLAASGVDLRGVSDGVELGLRVHRWAAAHPEGPIFGAGWDDALLSPEARPDREFLDRLVPDRPTYLDRICGHVSALNTAALERVGVRRGTRAHRGGRIGRGRDGEPNGLLVDGEVGRTNTLRRAAFRSRPAATRRLLKAWSDLGTTTVGAMYVDAEEFSELGQLSRARALPVGIRAYLRLEQYARRAPPTSGPDVHFAGVKAILDGSLGSRTAWLEQAYSDDPGERGHSLWAPAKLLGALRPAADAGHPIALHAIGDRALAEAIRTLEALGSPESSRIEHASVSPPAQLRRIARTGATVVIQPGFRTSDRWRTARLGVRRGRWTHAFARLAAAGIPLAGSSDAPVERADPWSGMRSASGRVSPGPDPHRLTPAQALGAYTVGGARALADPTLGSLVPGSPADLLVLAGSSPWEGIRAGRSPVLSTWRSGRRVAVLGAVPARSG